MKSRFWTSPWGIPDLSFLNGLIYFFNFWVFWLWNILLLLEGKSQCSCTYSSRLSKNTHKGTDQTFLSTFQKTASVKESTSHLGINFHRSVLPWVLEVFRFFTLIYKEVLTCSVRGTQPVSLIPTRSVLTTVIYGKFNNRSSCLPKTDWQQNVFYGSSPETAQVRKAGQV